MSLPDDFRAAMERGDVPYLRRFWREIMPNMPQPETDDAAEIAMHRTRTESATITFKARAYSHRWLEERAYPSGLPDELKPKAERIYPRNVGVVGISLNTRNPYLKPAVVEVRQAMEYAVNDAYADGRTEPAFVKQRMEEARQTAWRKLVG